MKNMHHSAPEFSLFVGDLPHDCSDDKLQRLFQQKFKSVKRVQIIRNEDGSSRGFGFIRFEDHDDFQAALKQVMKIGNVTLRLDMAHIRENRFNKNRSRFNSFNSTGNSSSSRHNHHFISSSNNHPHHHNQQHHHQPKQGSDGGSQQSQPQPSTQQQQQPQQQPPLSQPAAQHNLQPQQQQPPQQPLSQPAVTPNLQPQVNNNNNNNNNNNISSTSTSSTTNSSSTSTANHASSAIPNNHNLNTNQQAIGPDLRGYPAATMMDTHVLSMTDQPSMMPPTSVYGHLYPYGPPPFGYMPPPPQPNPVIPISAVPPAPPNQASPSAGVNQQHGHSLTATSSTRYNSGQHHHHHQQQQQQQQQPHAADGGISTLTGGVQAPHQGPPLYYYYPSPLYFDQAGGTAAPPSIYHTQPFHPQFFAMPNPAYMPNAHTFNQHQPQPPTASQSDATVINQQQPHQQQVNMRTRDIDTTIE